MRCYSLLYIAVFILFSGSAIAQIEFVNPFIGTGGHGHTYPGATAPFGMVQLSPDTRLTGWDGCSGYHYTDSLIYGFSHTHLSGTGVSDYGDVLLMPMVDKFSYNNGADGDFGYGSNFKKENEKAEAGFYSVYLEDCKTQVELTATERVGFHKYTFPQDNKPYIILDLEHRDQVLDAQINMVSNNRITGYRKSKAWAEDQRVYFVIDFSEEIYFSDFDFSVSGQKPRKAYFEFLSGTELKVKVGISATSIKGAIANLDAEIPHWDFEKTKAETQAKWTKQLGKIEVEGGTKNDKSIFYTALYHNMIAPNIFNDANGNYRGMDAKNHQTDGDHYTIFSLWDTYRATHPLYTLIEQDRTNDFINTFLRQHQDGGILPIWELAGNYTGCMIGYHSIPVIVDAYLKGINSFDAELALEAMVHAADQDHLGLDSYKELGFVSGDKESESVSKTLEYAYDDWCIAQMAKAMDKTEIYERFIRRAQNYKNIFDPSTGFMRAKQNNNWFEPFVPEEVNFHFTEANAWQYCFYVPQDVSGLMDLMGGQEAFANKLDTMFSTNSDLAGREQVDITGLIGQYAHGNEPSHHMAYLYNYAGQPWKCQEKVRQITSTLYSNEPDGLSGNEDCGQMSAWYVFSAMGFYPVTPGSNIYAIGSPVFSKVHVNFENGNRFTIEAPSNSSENIYIRSATLNGSEWVNSYLEHNTLLNGGILRLEMTNEKNEDWASSEICRPISKITDNLISATPYFHGKKAFEDSTLVEIKGLASDSPIFYTIDGSIPTLKSTIYSEPIKIKESTKIKAYVVHPDNGSSSIVSSNFYKIPEKRKIELNSEYASHYSGGGDMALIDFIRGGRDFRTGQWQGYEGKDIEAIVDLGEMKMVSELAVGFLQDENSWIFMPEWVEFLGSEDGITFSSIGVIENEISPKKKGSILNELGLKLETELRFLKVKIKSLGVCPPYHKGAGNKCWVFADEIIIKTAKQ